MKVDKKHKKADQDKDKPTLEGVTFGDEMSREDAIAHLEAVLAGLRAGEIQLAHGEDRATLQPPERLKLRVKAGTKGEKHQVSVKLSWRPGESEPLEIAG